MWSRRCSKNAAVFWLLLLLLTLLLPAPTFAFSSVITIDPYDDECYQIRTPSHWKGSASGNKSGPRFSLRLHYEQMDDQLSPEPLVVYVMDAVSEQVLFQNKKVTGLQGQHEMPLDPRKRYWVCLQNNQHGPHDEDGDHLDDESRTVAFRLDVVPTTADMETQLLFQQLDEAHTEAKAHARDWLEYSKRVDRGLWNIVDHFHFMRHREQLHRNVTERTFSDTLKWTIIEGLTVAVVAIGQIMYLRRFLETKQASYAFV